MKPLLQPEMKGLEQTVAVWKYYTHLLVVNYLGLAPGTLLYKTARQGGSHRVALKQPADGVTQTQGNKFLQKSRKTKYIPPYRILYAEKHVPFDTMTFEISL